MTSFPILIALTFFGYVNSASAYLDPGTGSVMLQFLLGGLAGAAFIIKLYYQNIKEKFRAWLHPGSEAENEEAPPKPLDTSDE